MSRNNKRRLNLYIRNEDVDTLEWAKHEYPGSLSNVIMAYLKTKKEEAEHQLIEEDPKLKEYILQDVYAECFNGLTYDSFDRQFRNADRDKNFSLRLAGKVKFAYKNYRQYYPEVMAIFCIRNQVPPELIPTGSLKGELMTVKGMTEERADAIIKAAEAKYGGAQA